MRASPLACIVILQVSCEFSYGQALPQTASAQSNRHQSDGDRSTIRRSRNFCIYSADGSVSFDEVSLDCELKKSRIESVWLSKEAVWENPCDVFLHASLHEYQRALGANVGESVGCATMRCVAGRVVGRRIDIRVDADDWRSNALPHELTHIILADLFGGNFAPPWLDEGIGVLSESSVKRADRVAAFQKSLSRKTIFSVGELMNVRSLPAPAYRDAFYVQSAALVRLFVDRRGHKDFAKFIDILLRDGEERALREIYGISSLDELGQIAGRSDVVRMVKEGGTLQSRASSANDVDKSPTTTSKRVAVIEKAHDD